MSDGKSVAVTAIEDGVAFEMDGDKWCAKGKGFVDLMTSPAGFGETQAEAYGDYVRNKLQHEREQVDAAEKSQVLADVDAEEIVGIGTNDDERLILRFLRRRTRLLAELTHVQEQTDELMRRMAREIASLDKWMLPSVEQATQRMKDAKRFRGRSLQTPFGTVGWRKAPSKLVVHDDAAAIAYVERRAADDPDWGPVVRTDVSKVIVKAELTKVVETCGEIPDGVSLDAGGDRFYAK